MNEDTPIVLIEVLDLTRLGVEFDSAGNTGCELFIWQLNACDLWIERAGNERTQESIVPVLRIVCAVGRRVG